MKHGTPVIPNPFFTIIPIPVELGQVESRRVTRSRGKGSRRSRDASLAKREDSGSRLNVFVLDAMMPSLRTRPPIGEEGEEIGCADRAIRTKTPGQ